MNSQDATERPESEESREDEVIEEPKELLILGLGNVLCGDDGLGVVAAETLASDYCPPDGVEILDGGTLGLSLLAWVTNTKRLLLVDAIRADLPAGSLVRLEGHEVAPAVRDRLSVHQIGVADLLDGMQLIGRSPPSVSLLGLVPASVALMTGLTPDIERALPLLVDAVVAETAELGLPLVRRNDVPIESSPVQSSPVQWGRIQWDRA